MFSSFSRYSFTKQNYENALETTMIEFTSAHKRRATLEMIDAVCFVFAPPPNCIFAPPPIVSRTVFFLSHAHSLSLSLIFLFPLPNLHVRCIKYCVRSIFKLNICLRFFDTIFFT